MSIYPTIDVPTYELKLPSDGRRVTYRPYVMKEEKILLTAAESRDDTQIMQATKQIVQNCLLDGTINVGELPSFDVDYIFAHIRTKAAGDAVELDLECNNLVNEERCGERFTASAKLSDIKVIQKEDWKPEINLGGGITVMLKYPTYNSTSDMKADATDIDRTFHVLAAAIAAIAKGEEVKSTKDHPKAALLDFIESLPRPAYNKLLEHVEQMPSFEVTIKTKCPKCQFDHELKYTDLSSFF